MGYFCKAAEGVDFEKIGISEQTIDLIRDMNPAKVVDEARVQPERLTKNIENALRGRKAERHSLTKSERSECHAESIVVLSEIQKKLLSAGYIRVEITFGETPSWDKTYYLRQFALNYRHRNIDSIILSRLGEDTNLSGLDWYNSVLHTTFDKLERVFSKVYTVRRVYESFDLTLTERIYEVYMRRLSPMQRMYMDCIREAECGIHKVGIYRSNAEKELEDFCFINFLFNANYIGDEVEPLLE